MSAEDAKAYGIVDAVISKRTDESIIAAGA